MDTWLRREARRQGRIVTLADALLSDRTLAYGLYRLRYFSLRCVSISLVHVIRLTLLQAIFVHKTYLFSLLLTAVAGFLASFWWGALEILRDRVRAFAREGRQQRIPDEIGRWLRMATALAAILQVAAMGWVLVDAHGARHGLGVFHGFVLAMSLRLGVDLITLTYHSGVYAIRRVYRPIQAMLAVDLVTLAMVWVCWPWLGSWSFPAAMIAGAGLGASLMLHYTRRVYRLHGWQPWHSPRSGGVRPRLGKDTGEFLSAGISHAVMKMDALLMMILFQTRSEPAGGVSLFVLFVCMAPAIRAGFDWAQLLYFDLKRLDVTCLGALLRRYERRAFLLALGVGAALWGLACGLGTVLLGQSLGTLYWLIAPFFFARSLLALTQIQAFSKRRYRVLLGGGLALGLMMYVMETEVRDTTLRLTGLAGLCLLIALATDRMTRASADRKDAPVILPLADWLRVLKDIRQPVRVRVLSLERGRPGRASPGETGKGERWRLRGMARRLARLLRDCGRITLIGRQQLAWFECDNAPPVSTLALLKWSGGLLTALHATDMKADGAAALGAALESNLLAGPLRDMPPPASTAAITPPLVDEAFARMMPAGILYDPDRPAPALLADLSSRERAAILDAAVRFSRYLETGAGDGAYDVTSWSTKGEMRRIFIVDRRQDPGLRKRWRKRVTRLNMESP